LGWRERQRQSRHIGGLCERGGKRQRRTAND
jgi:hypothetical protein